MPLARDTIAVAADNWDQAGWGATEAMTTATSIVRVHQILHRRIDEALAPLQLNFSRFEVLALLHFSRTGELPMGKIGDRLQVHAASVTNTIQRLETAGFVERGPHPTDRRTTLARLLPAGREAALRGAAILDEIDFGLTGMASAERQAVIEAGASYRLANGDFGDH